jgi:hypothetical protein
MRRWAFFVFLLASRGIGMRPFLSDEIVETLEAQLTDSCGDRCLNVFHQVVPLLRNATVTNDTSLIKEQFEGFNKFMSNYMSGGMKENSKLMEELHNITVSSFAAANVGSIKKHAPPAQPGLPCTTQAACDSLDFLINRCAHLRKASMTAYVGANAVLSVMANLITAGCACMFAGPVNVCVLRGFPYTCVFPYSAYSALYGLSQSLWTAVTKITATCNSGGALPLPT